MSFCLQTPLKVTILTLKPNIKIIIVQPMTFQTYISKNLFFIFSFADNVFVN